MSVKEDSVSEPEILCSEELDSSNKIYIVFCDQKPVLYCVSRKEARDSAKKFANFIVSKNISNYPLRIENVSKNKIVLTRTNNYIVISYDEIVSSIYIKSLRRKRN